MVHPNIKFLRAVGTMIGSVVGVGVFGLPYAFAQSGFVVGAVWLVALGFLMVALQLMYAEICIQTEGSHRLSGYVERYLGKRWGLVSFVILCGGLWGALIAFLIVGGRFSHILIGPFLGGQEWMYGLAFGILGGLLIWRGILFASKIEVWIICAILFLFSFAILAAFSKFQVPNVLNAHWNNTLIPYGVILFSLSGMAAVPEMKLILGRKQEKKLPFAILLAMVIILVLYFLFSLAIVGATGTGTTEAAFDGLIPLLGVTFGVVGTLLGAVTVLSIYMIVGAEFQNALIFDGRMTREKAFVLVAGVPILAYLLGIREFIGVVGFVGAIFSGLLGIIIVLTYERMRHSPVCKKHHCLDVPHWVSFGVIAIFAAGIVYTILNSLFSL